MVQIVPLSRLCSMLSAVSWKIRSVYEKVFSFEKVFHQYQPKPLKIPEHYCQTIHSEGDLCPLVTIVTPSYNQGEFLERTIQSVLRQNYSNVEYIVQDGGSTDATKAILEQYRPRLNFCDSLPDRGQAHAINPSA